MPARVATGGAGRGGVGKVTPARFRPVGMPRMPVDVLVGMTLVVMAGALWVGLMEMLVVDGASGSHT